MHLCWGPITFFCQSGRWFGQTMSCWDFWKISFVVLGGQKYQRDDSLGRYTSIHHINTLFPSTYDVRLLIDETFRGFAAKLGGFVSIAMFRGGDARFCGVLIRNTCVDAQRQWLTFNAFEGHPLPSLDIRKRDLSSWKAICTGVESNGGKSMWKIDNFIVNFVGRRPPRRVRAYKSTNNNKLNNIPMAPHQVIYLVGSYR